MKIKVIALRRKEHYKGFTAAIIPVSESGRVSTSSSLFIEISEKEMYGDEADTPGFKMAGLDDLIIEKVRESKMFNEEATKHIEFVRESFTLAKPIA